MLRLGTLLFDDFFLRKKEAKLKRKRCKRSSFKSKTMFSHRIIRVIITVSKLFPIPVDERLPPFFTGETIGGEKDRCN